MSSRQAGFSLLHIKTLMMMMIVLVTTILVSRMLRVNIRIRYRTQYALICLNNLYPTWQAVITLGTLQSALQLCKLVYPWERVSEIQSIKESGYLWHTQSKRIHLRCTCDTDTDTVDCCPSKTKTCFKTMFANICCSPMIQAFHWAVQIFGILGDMCLRCNLSRKHLLRRVSFCVAAGCAYDV